MTLLFSFKPLSIWLEVCLSTPFEFVFTLDHDFFLRNDNYEQEMKIVPNAWLPQKLDRTWSMRRDAKPNHREIDSYRWRIRSTTCSATNHSVPDSFENTVGCCWVPATNTLREWTNTQSWCSDGACLQTWKLGRFQSWEVSCLPLLMEGWWKTLSSLIGKKSFQSNHRRGVLIER